MISLHEESALVGQTATIAVKPQLLINNTKADIRLLKNCKIELKISNYMDSIQVTREHEVKFEEDRETLVKF